LFRSGDIHDQVRKFAPNFDVFDHHFFGEWPQISDPILQIRVTVERIAYQNLVTIDRRFVAKKRNKSTTARKQIACDIA